MDKKTWVLTIIIVILAALAVGEYAYFNRNKSADTAADKKDGENSMIAGNDRDEHGCIGSAGYQWCDISQKCLRIWEEPCSTTADFICANKKILTATFMALPEKQVNLSLNDGRNIILPQTTSAGGARYANSNESIVFWNKGDTAFLQENDKETYSNCSTIKK